MTTLSDIPKQIEDLLSGRAAPSRRDFLKTSGLLVVTFSAGSVAGPLAAQTNGGTAPAGASPYPDPDFHQLDSWVVVHENNTATFYAGKTDLGQGTGTAFRQIDRQST